jgi:hypothetical protein
MSACPLEQFLTVHLSAAGKRMSEERCLPVRWNSLAGFMVRWSDGWMVGIPHQLAGIYETLRHTAHWGLAVRTSRKICNCIKYDQGPSVSMNHEELYSNFLCIFLIFCSEFLPADVKPRFLIVHFYTEANGGDHSLYTEGI